MHAEMQPSHSSRVGRRSTELVAATLLAGAVWMVYGPALDAPFLCDDSVSIVENESIHAIWPLWGGDGGIGSLAPPADLPTSGRPLVNLSFAINFGLHGLDPRGYRAVNIVLHLFNVWLLALVVRRTLRLPHFRGRFDAAAGPLAFVAALVWAVHPLATETVVYVTQRTELMVTLCYLATLYSSLRYWEAKQFGWLLAAVFACWTGMASKEVMASAPVLVLLFDRTFLAGSFREAWQRSRLLYVGLFSSWLLLLCLAGPGPRAASAGFHLGIAATDWWFTQCQMLVMYLKLAFWPWPLSIHYEPPYLTTFSAAWMYVLPVALLVVATLALLWRKNAVGYVGAFAFAILAPTMVVPIVTEIAAERRMYMPLAALVTLLVVGSYVALRRLLAEKQAIAGIAGIAVLVACVGGVVSSRRLAVYADELALWQDVLDHQPESSVAQYNVGTIFLDRHEPEQAVDYFRRAIAARDDYPRAHHNLGAALSALGQREEASREFERAVELEPRYTLGHIKLGITAMKAGRTDDAIRDFKAALEWQPNNAAAHIGLSGALLATGELEDAVYHAQAAVTAEPDNAEAHNLLGAGLAQQGQFPEAVEQFEAAVRLDPKLLQAVGNLMAAYASLGRRDDAIATAERALQLAQANGDSCSKNRSRRFSPIYTPSRLTQQRPPTATRNSNTATMAKKRKNNVPIVKPKSGPPAWLAAIVLALGVWSIYVWALDAPFIFDDLLSVQDNPSITQLWPLVGDENHPGPLRPVVETPTAARPLVNFSFALNYHFSRQNPRGYRLFNLALHFANAMLLWAIVGRTLRLPRFAGRYDNSAGYQAVAVALLWAVHPLLTETVTYVTQRTELMVVCFYLATMYSSMRYWSAPATAARRGWLAAATLACFAGAASKEVMITAPLVVLLFEWTFIGGTVREMLRRSWPLYLGLLSSWLLIFALQANTPRSQSAGFAMGIDLLDWWSTQAHVFWMYLKLAFYPWPLLIHYEMSLKSLAANWPYVLAAIALGVVTAGLVWRRNAAGFLLACVFLILAPTHLVPIPTEMAAERRMYLPLAALVALVVIGAFVLITAARQRSMPSPNSFFRGRRLTTAGFAMVIVFALVYAVASAQRVALFNEPIALWEDVVADQPESHLAQYGLATSLAAVRRTAEAIEHYRVAVRVNPTFAEAQYGLGLSLAQTGHYDESIEHLQEVVRLKPAAYQIRNNLGVVLFTAERYPEAIAEFEKTLAIKPDFVEAQDNLNRARRASVLPQRAE